MRVVNGHFCRTCAEEALAKQGLDPKYAATAIEQPSHERTKSSLVETPRGVNEPVRGASIGGLLNLRA